MRRLVVQSGAVALVVLLAVGVVGVLLSRRTAENQSVHQAVRLTDVIAESVIQPLLTDQMATDSTALTAALAPAIRAGVLTDSVARVKVWTPTGTIVYSDEPRLIGKTFGLDKEEREVFASPQTRAEISDLKRPENEFERGNGKLLEVYRPVWTPGGRPLLFEMYYRYDDVAAQSSQLWRGLAGITLSSVVAIFVLLVPIGWALFERTRRAQKQRELAMQRAVDASLEERRRIAASLHDGVVQQLVGASYAVAAAADRADTRGETELASELAGGADALRTSIGGLRSLLVDIYPASVRSAGLPAAITDLVSTLTGRGPDVSATVDDAAARLLTPGEQEAVFRIVQELLRNAVVHAQAAHVDAALVAVGDAVELTVTDDGVGLDVASVHVEGHFGMRLVSDLVQGIGAELDVRSDGGTIWRLRVRVA